MVGGFARIIEFVAKFLIYKNFGVEIWKLNHKFVRNHKIILYVHFHIFCSLSYIDLINSPEYIALKCFKNSMKIYMKI